MRRMFVVIMVAVLLMTAGCGSANIKLGAQANGTTINVQPGQVITITLDSNPTTGYSWYVVGALPDLFQQVGEPVYKQANTAKNVVGAGGTLSLTFKVVKAGTATLNLGYMRSFEEKAPIETFSVIVNAAAK